ncbi:MAG TPA: CbbQ/NirQ/NorQ/GpvN family protein [Verrucomicrobiales bacterium]|nr:CbbQ/NirQ/NorQ/GpvN family protein [Verrucomicrobiales bacterium]
MSGKEIFYLETGRESELFEETWKARLPIMLKGPTGCGKTRFVEHMAAKLGRPLITVACNEDTSATDLLGRHLLVGGETVWCDGPVTRAVREGAILYLDEIAEARADAIVVIHPLTDYRRELFLDRTGETLEASPEFMLVISYNPGYQRSMRELKASTRQRFVGYSFGYPTEDVEIRILCGETGIESDAASKLVAIAKKVRNLTELSLVESVSTRLLVDAAILIQRGLPPRFAAASAIAEPLTDDPDALKAIRQIIDLTL